MVLPDRGKTRSGGSPKYGDEGQEKQGEGGDGAVKPLGGTDTRTGKKNQGWSDVIENIWGLSGKKKIKWALWPSQEQTGGK